MSKSILIVDDDKRLRELLEDYLSEKKYKIFLCEDFADAEEILEYFVFDLIIVDRMMPSGDGIDLIKTVKDKIEFNYNHYCELFDVEQSKRI
jgi:DNA-binding response OmpR family regulator